MNANQIVAEALEDQPLPEPAPTGGTSGAPVEPYSDDRLYPVEKWGNALRTLRELQAKRQEQAAIEAELEYAIGYRHELAKKGLKKSDVDHVLRRGQPPGVLPWRMILKRKGDPRAMEAYDHDVIGVHTHAGQDVLFDEWLKPPPKREKPPKLEVPPAEPSAG